MTGHIKDCLLILRRSLSNNVLDEKLVLEVADYFKHIIFDDDFGPELLLISDPCFGILTILREAPNKNARPVKLLLNSLLKVVVQLETLSNGLDVAILNVCITYVRTCQNTDIKNIIYLIISETNKKKYINNHMIVNKLTASIIEDFNVEELSMKSLIICKVLVEISTKQMVASEINSSVLQFCTLLLELEISFAEKKLGNKCTGIIDTASKSLITIFECLDSIKSETYTSSKNKGFVDRLFICIKKCIIPPRKVIFMNIYLPVLNYFNDKVKIFSNYLLMECAWFNNLFNNGFLEISFKKERELTKLNFYRELSSALSSLDADSPLLLSTLNYFKLFFESEFDKPILFPFDNISHIQGFSIFFNDFKRILGQNESKILLSNSINYLLPFMVHYIESVCTDSLDCLLTSSTLIAEISEQSSFFVMLNDLCIKAFSVYPLYNDKENLQTALIRALFIIDNTTGSLPSLIHSFFYLCLNTDSVDNTNNSKLESYKELIVFFLSGDGFMKSCNILNEGYLNLSRKIFVIIVKSIIDVLTNLDLSLNFVNPNHCKSLSCIDYYNIKFKKNIFKLLIITDLLECLCKVKPDYLMNNVESMFSAIIDLIYTNPLVEQLYHLLLFLLKVISPGSTNSITRDQCWNGSHQTENVNERSVGLCFIYLNNFICKLLNMIIYFEGDLFIAAFKVILAVPLHQSLILEIISCRDLFKSVLMLSISNLSLVKFTVTSLINWSNLSIEMCDFIECLIPYFKPFLVCNEAISSSENAYLMKSSISEHILFLISKTCPSALDSILSIGDFSADFYLRPIAKFFIPLLHSEHYFRIDVSEMIPSTIKLLMTSLDIKVRRNCCDLYKFYIMYILQDCFNRGNISGNAFTVWKELCRPLLFLSVDVDPIIRSILNPLSLQISRNLALCNHSLPVVSNFFDLLIDGISHPVLSSVRYNSSRCLTEFLISTLNLPQDQLKTFSFSLSNILTRLSCKNLFLPRRRFIGEIMVCRSFLNLFFHECYFNKEHFLLILKQTVQSCIVSKEWSCELECNIKIIHNIISNEVLLVELDSCYVNVLDSILCYSCSSEYTESLHLRNLFETLFFLLSRHKMDQFISNYILPKIDSFYNLLCPIFVDKQFPILLDMKTLHTKSSFCTWLKFSVNLKADYFIKSNYIKESVISFLGSVTQNDFLDHFKSVINVSGSVEKVKIDRFKLAIEMQYLLNGLLESITDILESFTFDLDQIQFIVDSIQFHNLVMKLIFQPFAFYPYTFNFNFFPFHISLVTKIFKILANFPLAFNRILEASEPKVYEHFQNVSGTLHNFDSNDFSISKCELEAVFVVRILKTISPFLKSGCFGNHSLLSTLDNLTFKVIHLEQSVYYCLDHFNHKLFFDRFFCLKSMSDDDIIKICIDYIKITNNTSLKYFSKNIFYHFHFCPETIYKLIVDCFLNFHIWFIEYFIDFCICELKPSVTFEAVFRALKDYSNSVMNWANKSPENKMRVFFIIYHLIGRVKTVDFCDKVFLEWLLEVIMSLDPSYRVLSIKLIILYMNDTNFIGRCLKGIVSMFFDDSCSPKADLNGAWQMLHFVFQRTGSSAVAELFFKYIDFNSAIVCDFQDSLISWLKKKDILSLTEELNIVFKIFTDYSHSSRRRFNIAKNILNLYLNNLPEQLVFDFYLKIGPYICQTVRRQNNVSPMSDQELISLLVCYNLIENLYRKFDLGQLESNELLTSFSFENLKCLNLFILSSAQELRNMDSSVVSIESYQLLKELHCVIYHMLISLIIKTQCDEFVFAFYLFQEDPNEGKFIWKNLFDTTLTIDFDSYKANIDYSSEFKKIEIKKNFDKNKCYRLDAFNFDFTSTVFEMTTAENLLSLKNSFDIINNHPVMAPLCELIEFLPAKFLCTNIEDCEQNAPFYVKMVMISLQQNPTLVKSFLLKVIFKCQSVFKPFGSICTDPILGSIINESCGTSMNYFLFDILSMVLDWSFNMVSKCMVNKMISYYIKLKKSCIEDIFKVYLNLMVKVINKWDDLLEIPYHEITALLKSSDIDEVTKGVEIALTFIAHSSKSFDQTVKNNFSRLLLDITKRSKGILFLRLVELNSLFLNKIIYGGGDCCLNFLDMPYIEKLDRFLSDLFKKNKLSYLNCLSIFQECHKNMLVKQLDKVLNIAGDCSEQNINNLALKLMSKAVCLIDPFFLSVEFKKRNIFSNLLHVSPIVVLNRLKLFLEFSRALPFVLVEPFLVQISDYLRKKKCVVEIRSIIYDIYITLHKRRLTVETLSEKLTPAIENMESDIFNGLNDKSSFIRNKIISYLVDTALPDSINDCVLKFLKHFKLPENELFYTKIISYVVLKKCSLVIGKYSIIKLNENSDSIVNVHSCFKGNLNTFGAGELTNSYNNLTYLDFLEPLYELSFFNSNFSVVVFNSLLTMILSNKNYIESNCSIEEIINYRFSAIFNSSYNFSIPVFSCLCSLISNYNLSISTYKDEFFYVARKCQLEKVAVIVFEREVEVFNRIINSYKEGEPPDDSCSDDYIKLAFLYYYLSEFDTAVFVASTFCSPAISDAFKAMSNNQWDRALKLFRELSEINSKVFLKELFSENARYCLLHMCAWSRLYQELLTTKFVPSFSNYFDCHKMLLLFKCDVFINFDSNSLSDNDFCDVILKLAQNNYTSLSCCVEICLLCLRRSDSFLRTFVSNILGSIINLGNYCNFQSLTRTNDLNQLFKLMTEFLLFNTVKNTDNDGTFLKYLMNSNVKCSVDTADSFLWERIVNARALLMDATLSLKSSDRLKKMALTRWFSAIFKHFISLKNFHACRNYLLKLYDLEGGSLTFNALHIEFALLKYELEVNFDHKIKSLKSVFKIVNDLKMVSSKKVHVLQLKCSDLLWKCLTDCVFSQSNKNLTALLEISKFKSNSVKELCRECLSAHTKYICLGINFLNDSAFVIKQLLLLLKLPLNPHIEMTFSMKIDIDQALIQIVFALLRLTDDGFIFLPVIFQLDLSIEQNKNLFLSCLKTIDPSKLLFWFDELIVKLEGKSFSIFNSLILNLAKLNTPKLGIQYFFYRSKLKYLGKLHSLFEFSSKENDFLISFKFICHPTVKLIRYVSKIQQCILIGETSIAKELFENLMSDCFYSESVFIGSIFKLNDVYRTYLVNLKNEFNHDTAQSVCDKLKFFNINIAVVKSIFHLKLDVLCPYLFNRTLDLNFEFQAYDRSKKYYYKIFKVLPNIKFVSNLNYMVDLNVLDTTGKIHRWLVCYDQDAKLLMNFSKLIYVCGLIIQRDHSTDNFPYYCVTPLYSDVCIIEIPQSMSDLSSWIDLGLSDYDSTLRLRTIYDQYQWIIDNSDGEKTILSMVESMMETGGHKNPVLKFKSNVSKFPYSIFKKSFMAIGSLYDYRKEFLLSYSFSSIVHWLLSSSLNLHNTFTSFKDGGTLAIPSTHKCQFFADENINSFLPIRLTSQFLLLSPFNEIVFMKIFFKLMKSLDKDIVMPVLHCMSFDSEYPSLRMNRNCSDTNIVKLAELKFNGQNPFKLIEPILSKYKIDISNLYKNFRTDKLCLEAQIDCIIHLSKDENILALCWAASEPWL